MESHYEEPAPMIHEVHGLAYISIHMPAHDEGAKGKVRPLTLPAAPAAAATVGLASPRPASTARFAPAALIRGGVYTWIPALCVHVL
eukprot:1156840-Pelagomonas_calceolata.AAC.4